MSFDLKLIAGDLIIKNGDLDIVEGSDKLVQDVLKLISTPLGSNPFFPAYGSPISKALIGKIYEQEFLEDIATHQLKSSIERLQQLQLEQLKQNQAVTPDEQIAVIENIKVSQARNDSRYYLIYLTVISKSFQRIPISFGIDTF
jgi:phage baseplate assembly protein W